MRVLEDVDLSKYSTMRLGGTGKFLTKVTDKHELAEAVRWAKEHKKRFIVIGGGSNIAWSDSGFSGLIIVNKIPGYEVKKDTDTHSYITVGAGEDWDKVVERTVEAGLHGIEALSLIPGTAGATPVQNVGAYGQEIAQTLVSVEAYDTQLDRFVVISSDDCSFGYRDSRFKSKDRGRFMIVSLTLELQRVNPRPPFYPAVATYFREKRIRVVTPRTLRQAVIAIRQSKLPDPKKIANNGSYFANPIVPKSKASSLLKTYPLMPHWEAPHGIKLSAAWLIEQANLKDVHDKKTGMATWAKQPLVLVNEQAKTTKDLIRFRNRIIETIDQNFGVSLVPEPEILP